MGSTSIHTCPGVIWKQKDVLVQSLSVFGGNMLYRMYRDTYRIVTHVSWYVSYRHLGGNTQPYLKLFYTSVSYGHLQQAI